MISQFLGIDPALVFFMLLTTVSASLWFAASVVENSLEPFFHNLVAFVGSFLLSFIVLTLSMLGIIQLFYASLRFL